MKFTKMQGLGNDYVYVNCFEETVGNPSGTAIKVSDRHFGIGADGLILICPSEKADFRMRMFNADGSEGEMCGNGIRCVGKYVYDKGMTDNTTVAIETLAGIKILEMDAPGGKVSRVTVDMGEPVFNPGDIPVKHEGADCIAVPVRTSEGEYEITCVSMGNPHAVIYVDSLEAVDIAREGPAMENHIIFPNRVNTEFVKVVDRENLYMRVWERGSGETLACGTGACAVLAASVVNGKSEREATVGLLGGELVIRWDEEDNHIYMTGPAETVFEGVIDL